MKTDGIILHVSGQMPDGDDAEQIILEQLETLVEEAQSKKETVARISIETTGKKANCVLSLAQVDRVIEFLSEVKAIYNAPMQQS